MRVLFAATILVGAALCWSASSATGVSAQGQATQAALTGGERVQLSFPDHSGFKCTVMEVRGDFVGCKGESQGIGRPATDRWINLRLVSMIERPGKDE